MQPDFLLKFLMSLFCAVYCICAANKIVRSPASLAAFLSFRAVFSACAISRKSPFAINLLFVIIDD